MTIEDAPGYPLNRVTRARLSISRVWEGLPRAEIYVMTAGGVEGRNLLEQGRQYVLFLEPAAGKSDEFWVLLGLAGRFVLQDERIFKYCVNYVDQSEAPASGSGQDQTLEAFDLRLQQLFQ